MLLLPNYYTWESNAEGHKKSCEKYLGRKDAIHFPYETPFVTFLLPYEIIKGSLQIRLLYIPIIEPILTVHVPRSELLTISKLLVLLG